MLIKRNQQINRWRFNSKLSKKRGDLTAMVGLVIDDMRQGQPNRITPGSPCLENSCTKSCEALFNGRRLNYSGY